MSISLRGQEVEVVSDATEAASLPYLFSVPSPCFYLPFDQEWVDESGAAISVPFEREANRAYTLHYAFRMTPAWPEDLCLWIERVAGEAEVTLNNRYLVLHRQPFDQIFLPLDTGWLVPGINTISVTLNKGALFPHAPSPVLGFWGQSGLIRQAEWQQWQRPISNCQVNADTVALIAPLFYIDSLTYQFDPFRAMRMFLPVVEHNIKYVHYLFPPDLQTASLAMMLGLTCVDSIAPSTQVAWINSYPQIATEGGQLAQFWLGENGERMVNYGEFHPWQRPKQVQDLPTNKWLLMFMVLFPLFGIFLIKGTDPSFYQNFSGMLFVPKRFADLNADISLSTGGWVLIYGLIKAIVQACWLALGVFYLQESQQWPVLANLLGTDSLFIRLLPGSDSLQVLLGRACAITIIWQALKFTILGMIGGVFRINGFGRKILALDLIGSFPLIFAISLPFVIGIFIGDRISFFNYLAVSTFLLYFLRKLYVLYIGLDRSFGFSVGMKILYICTFNIVPYVLWV